MCGLVGMLTTGATSDAEIKLFKNLLLVDQLRGEHATGVFKVDLAKNEVKTIKRAANAIDFLAEQEVKDFIEKERVNLYVGHNRYATMGDKGKHENAHPFQHEHITMVHNGGVDPYALDLLEGYTDKDVEVDSHMVCMTIAKHGAKEAITQKLAGAFALIWWDSKARTLNFIRNDDRPLFFAVTTSGAIVWASEKAFLDVFIDRAGKYTGYRVKPILMPADELNTFEFTETGIKKGTGPVVTPMEFLEVHYPKYNGAANKTWWESNASSTPTTSTNRSGSGKSTADLDNIMRINKTLEQVPCRLRFGSVITADVDDFEPYSTNKTYGNLEVICRDPKVRVKAWGLKAADLEGVKVVRGTISNAYEHTINGSKVVTIVMDKVGISCHDPKYSVETSPNISTSHGDMEKKKRESEDLKRIEEAKAAEKTRNEKPRMRIVNNIHYPLKVSGHTFQSAAEFREFVSKGCSFCSNIPEAYNTQNAAMTVYEGEGFNGLLEDCEFICGKCSEA